MAGPITGTVYGEGEQWRDHVKNTLEPHGIQCLSPMRGKSRFFDKDQKFVQTNYADHPMVTNHGITIRDTADVRRSDLVFVNFNDADRVSIGSVLEVGIAHGIDTPVVVVMDSEQNPHWHGMVREMSVVLPTIEEAIYYTKHFFGSDE